MKIGIIGLGLIGGSLGLDLRKCGHIIYGVSRKESTCRRALERGVVNHANIDLFWGNCPNCFCHFQMLII